MDIKVISLASGSKGNCTYISDGKTNILIDMGISYKRLRECLRQVDVDISTISAVLVTHEHSDHIKGIPQLVKCNNISVICPPQVYEQMINYNYPINEDYHYNDCGFNLDSLFIQPFRTLHDTVYPVGYSVYSARQKASVVTDLGKVNPAVITNVKGSDIVVLESNHDIAMLKSGSYPYCLKQRILGSHGHLSNDDSAEFACALCESGTKKLILAHLSEENNLPQLAYDTSAAALTKMGAVVSKDISIQVAKQLAITYCEV